MPTFKLGQCQVDLKIEPLTGPLAAADRQLAWRVYLALTTTPALRDDTLPFDELRRLVADVRALLEAWPAAQIEGARPGHLGHVLTAVIEMILLPCLSHGRTAPAVWEPVRGFCFALARELARLYQFPDAGANVPSDLDAAWRGA